MMLFHHVGWACVDIDQETAAFRLMGYEPEGPDFTDPLQGVTGRFLLGPGPRLELLAELPGSTVLQTWLSGGVQAYHLAFAVDSLEVEQQRLRGEGAVPLGASQPAVAFGGRRIVFLMLPNRALVELVEDPGSSRPPS
jgi:methylmalonyl-CoA/ethylmalonyl-CoA epimerase